MAVAAAAVTTEKKKIRWDKSRRESYPFLPSLSLYKGGENKVTIHNCKVTIRNCKATIRNCKAIIHNCKAIIHN